MKSSLPKVLHPVGGRPMLESVLMAARSLDPASITVIVGYKAELVKARADLNVRYVVQEPQLGTAHALLQAEEVLSGAQGSLVLLSGDVPLLRGETLDALVRTHHATGAVATIVTAVVEHPYGYGRIVLADGGVARIVEERDASPEQRKIREINAGIYAFDLAPLWATLRGIASQNTQGEYYLTDLVAIYRRRKLPVETLQVRDSREIRGINSRTELADVTKALRQQKNEELMAAGVTLIDPSTTYIDEDVEVGPDTVIHPAVILEGHTQIGPACEIQANVRITDSTLGSHVTVKNFCVIVRADIADRASIGPFAYLRPETTVGPEAHVGTFVELKKTALGPKSKVNHLTYLGDATIGAEVNIGAGTITCNYDGVKKHETVIEDAAFIGSNSQLIAPVRIGKGAYVGAGSSITSDVPPGALGIARGRQANIEGWMKRKKAGEPKPDGSAS
jgi:bifunctional UDP-N-acetylglucosamine pyrophosphorylase/glucosamine-1-phosphate N-acetyltransferase